MYYIHVSPKQELYWNLSKNVSSSTALRFTKTRVVLKFPARVFRLASIHNVRYYLNLMSEARKAILDDKWLEFKKEFYLKRGVEI